ncbi:SDR family NAD(P)-dependent oxidoreductase [Hyphomonas sp.]|uniref:SDR family NAD(P)-dependent oxidoreductase n=1 Tax=Hyphomonas sp. TaxID=87 RepID=UPI003919FA77
MDLQLKARSALILGGTRGIGRAIADTLAAEGANVGICARNADQVAETVGALKAAGVSATGRSVDVTDGAALKAWIADATAELGGLNILVSNAGAMAQGNDPAAWKQNFELDVLAAVNAFDAAKGPLQKAAAESGDAAFIIISSISAALADRGDSYGPVKAALIHMAKGLAREHAASGVRVNVVSPGMVYFEGGIWHRVKTHAPDFFAQANSRNPTGRCATPQEIANAAVFLASPLSSYTNGSNLIVDGALSDRVNF